MELLYNVAYFFGGMFFVNAIPHFVSALMGHSFQTPFARPRGIGKSSVTINILWA